MTLYLYEQPFEDLLFDDDNVFEDHFFDYPMMMTSRHYYSPFERQQLSEAFHPNDFLLNYDDDDDFDELTLDPEINIKEDKNKNKYFIRVNLPGMTKNQIKMVMSDDRMLTISGEKESYYCNGGKNRNRNQEMACSYDQFEKSINIPEDANLETLRAKMENGVLKIVINKLNTSSSSRDKHHYRNIHIQ